MAHISYYTKILQTLLQQAADMYRDW